MTKVNQANRDKGNELPTAPPTPRKTAKRQRTVGDMIDGMRASFLLLERAIAGYNALSGALNTLMGTVPDGERNRGLPIFYFKATANGRDSVDVCVDLKHIDPQHVPYVLSPLIHAQGRAAQAALVVMTRDIQEVSRIIERAMIAQSEPGESSVPEEPVEAGDARADGYVDEHAGDDDEVP